MVRKVKIIGRTLGVSGLIAKLKQYSRIQVPVTDVSEFRSESDVEQKLVYPFLVHPSFMDIPPGVGSDKRVHGTNGN